MFIAIMFLQNNLSIKGFQQKAEFFEFIVTANASENN